MANNDGFYSLYDSVLINDLYAKTNSDKIKNIIHNLIELGIIQAITKTDINNNITKIQLIYDVTLYENTLRVVKKYKHKVSKNVNTVMQIISQDIQNTIGATINKNDLMDILQGGVN
jgi:predicted transcriptional regulator